MWKKVNYFGEVLQSTVDSGYKNFLMNLLSGLAALLHVFTFLSSNANFPTPTLAHFTNFQKAWTANV